MDYQSGPNAPAAEEEVIDLREYLKILSKYKKFIILGTIFCMVLAFIWSYLVLSPVYEAKTLLLVTSATSQLQTTQTQQDEDLEDVVGTLSRQPVLTMNTYLGQLKSEILFKRVIEDLGLDCDAYTPAGISAMVNATVVKDSNLIEVTVQNTDPQLAAAIANNLNKQFLNLISEKNEEQMSRSINFLKDQSKTTDVELETAVNSLKEFQQEPHGVAVLEQEFAKKSEVIATLESQLEMAEIEMDQLRSAVVRLQKELDGMQATVPVSKTDPTTGTDRYVQEANPQYASTYQELRDKKGALSDKVAEIEGMSALVKKNRAYLDSMQAELAGKKLHQEKLQGEVDRLKTTSDTLALKTTETQISKSINLGDTSVVVMSEASVPRSPVKPNKRMNIAISMVIGLMLFTLLSFILEHMDNTLKSPEDVKKVLELSVLGVIPHIDQKTRNIIYGDNG